MKSTPRIPTRRSIGERIFEYMESSWIPAIVIYAVIGIAVAAANWSQL